MKSFLGIVGFGVALVGCGLSVDGRLAVYEPKVRTQYRDVLTQRFVGCRALDGVLARTQLRVSFSTTGALSSAVVRLAGHTTSPHPGVFQAAFSTEDGTLVSPGWRVYTALFDAGSPTKPDLPARGGLVAPRGVVDVSVHDLDRVGGTYGGFTAHVTGRSDTGAPASAPSSDLVPVYHDCTFVRRTAETV